MGKIIFLHPDLGIGGAERLVVDAALALKNKGHDVSFITNHHDPGHCFIETSDGTLPVTVVGDWLPRNIFGKFYALCAYARMVYAAIYIAFRVAPIEKPDVIFCDLISLGIPILKLARNKPSILFYCHFPDQLLSKPGNKLKNLYRAPLNWLEEYTTGQADRILVNSKFTARVFKETFKSLTVTPDILYPSINTHFFDKTKETDIKSFVNLQNENILFLSINRYERKKNVSLALQAFSLLKNEVPYSQWSRMHLIIAGGYDNRVIENIEYFNELLKLAESLDLVSKLTFLQSPSDEQKLSLLKNCTALIYTPANEHFGIVPLEGMYMSKPVIACNSGGPTETVVNTVTGFLCKPEPKEFAEAMKETAKDTGRMGEAGRKRFIQRFSLEAFTQQLEEIVKIHINKNKKKN